ncbi:monocarboxylate transporter 12-like [Glandiceps talaboti]
MESDRSRKNHCGKNFESETNDHNDRMSSDGKDGGIYGWLVIVGCHVCYMFVFGVYQSLGPVFVALQTSFESGSARTSWVIAITGSIEMAFGPIANISVKKIGYRGTVILGGIISSIGLLLTAYAPTLEFVYFSFGVLYGCGHGLIAFPPLGLIPIYIKKRYAIANAFVVCGSGIGIFVFTPLWQLLIETYGWRGAFIIFAAINANLCVCGTLFKLPKMTKTNLELRGTEHFDDMAADESDNEVHSTAKTNALRQINEICDCSLYIKYPIFDVIAFASLLGISAGFFGIPSHMVARAKSMSLSSERNIALIMSIFGAVGIIGRLAPPVILRFKPHSMTSTSLFGVALILAGITNLFSPFADTYSKYCVYTAFLGLFCGLFYSLYSQATNDVVGSSNLTAALCVSSPWGCIGGLIGPTVGGWIYDITKEYNNSFYFYGSCMVFAGLTTFLSEPIYRLCRGEIIVVRDERYENSEQVVCVSTGTNTG